MLQDGSQGVKTCAVKTHTNFSRRVPQDAHFCCCQDAEIFFKTCPSRRSNLLSSRRSSNISRRLGNFQDVSFKTLKFVAVKTLENFSRRVCQDAHFCCCQDAEIFFKTCPSRRSNLLSSRRSSNISRRLGNFQDVSFKTLKFVAVKTLENFSRRVRQDASFLCCHDACKFFKTHTINFQDGVSRRSTCCQDATPRFLKN